MVYQFFHEFADRLTISGKMLGDFYAAEPSRGFQYHIDVRVRGLRFQADFVSHTEILHGAEFQKPALDFVMVKALVGGIVDCQLVLARLFICCYGASPPCLLSV